MNKLVTLKFGNGSLETGLSVILQIGEEGQPPTVELTGSLPPALALEQSYQRWQVAYRQLGLTYRLEAKTAGFATNVSNVEDCRDVARELSEAFNAWLSQDSFRPLREKLLEQLAPQDSIRIVLQTQSATVQHLPWHTWSLCDRYPKAEIALSAPAYERVEPYPTNRQKIRILAVIGHSEGIDTQTDRALLDQLPQADVQYLIEPDRQRLNDHLWDPAGWDILFFAGHSDSQLCPQTTTAPTTGQLYLNPTDTLTIPELKHALRKARERGLKIALFNSCDGLGLAQALADLHIPQVLVMREPVPDKIAHEFLKSFLEAFARGEAFYLAVREAREKLQGLENHYPCATWLPIICQNPAELPPTWLTLNNAIAVADVVTSDRPIPASQPTKMGWRAVAIASLCTTLVTLGCRQAGLLQTSELWGLQQFMTLRSRDLPDSRILIIEVTEADVQAQAADERRGSLSDAALSQVLEMLEPMEPRVIGLDIYRDFEVSASQPQLAQQLQSTEELIAICKTSDSANDVMGIAPPPDVPAERVGFSDFVVDGDGAVRRHLLALTPEPASSCQSTYGLSTLVALNYLSQEGLEPIATDQGHLQVGEAVFRPLDANFGGYRGIEAGGHQVLLNYRQLSSPSQVADRVTLGDVLAGRVNAEAVRDRIVLIGTTAASFGDYWLTPFPEGEGSDRMTPGICMQAQMVSQVLDAALGERPLIRAWPDWGENLWIVGWISVSGLIAYGVTRWPVTQRSLLPLLGCGLAVELTLFGMGWLMFTQSGYWVPWVPPMAAIVINVGGMAAYAHLQESTSQRLNDFKA